MSSTLENHSLFEIGADAPPPAPPAPSSSTPDADASSAHPPSEAAPPAAARTAPAAGGRTDRQAFHERSIAGRKPDTYVFMPKESAFYREETLHIRSYPMQVAFRKSFQRSALALFETDLIIPIIAPTDEKAREVFDAVDSTTRAFTEWASNETARVEAILDVNGVKQSGEFSDPLVAPVRVYSPRLYPVIALFKAVDNLMFLKSLLWISGHMDEIAYKRAAYEARVRMLRLARKLWEIHTGAISQLNRERRRLIEEANEEREERARHAADLRAKRAEMVLARIEERVSQETEEDRNDPLGQEELEVEMGTTLDAAADEMDNISSGDKKPAKTRKKKDSA